MRGASLATLRLHVLDVVRWRQELRSFLFHVPTVPPARLANPLVCLRLHAAWGQAIDRWQDVLQAVLGAPGPQQVCRLPCRGSLLQ
eukprot:15409429-Heterocapsa_arctica.AAC.1